jgi:hypothetical protein
MIVRSLKRCIASENGEPKTATDRHGFTRRRNTNFLICVIRVHPWLILSVG